MKRDVSEEDEIEGSTNKVGKETQSCKLLHCPVPVLESWRWLANCGIIM